MVTLDVCSQSLMLSGHQRFGQHVVYDLVLCLPDGSILASVNMCIREE
jgi:hypothetical protein